jgi:hypothetical protein
MELEHLSCAPLVDWPGCAVPHSLPPQVYLFSSLDHFDNFCISLGECNGSPQARQRTATNIMQDPRTQLQLCRQVNVLLLDRLLDVCVPADWCSCWAASCCSLRPSLLCMPYSRYVLIETVPVGRYPQKQSLDPAIPILPDMRPGIACCLLE